MPEPLICLAALEPLFVPHKEPNRHRVRAQGDQPAQVRKARRPSPIPIADSMMITQTTSSGTVCPIGGASVLASRLVSSLAPPNCTTTKPLTLRPLRLGRGDAILRIGEKVAAGQMRYGGRGVGIQIEANGKPFAFFFNREPHEPHESVSAAKALMERKTAKSASRLTHSLGQKETSSS